MAGGTERVAISATGTSVDEEMDHHFGRCVYFVIAEGKNIYVVENPARDAAEGAGLKAAQLMMDLGVTMVITGSLGPKATQALDEAGIRHHVGASGKVCDVLQRYREGRPGPSAGIDQA